MSGTSNTPEQGVGQPKQPGNAVGSGAQPEQPKIELDETTKRILAEDMNAALLNAVAEEVGLSTDPASNEPRRNLGGA